jgi:hypothetical protein
MKVMTYLFITLISLSANANPITDMGVNFTTLDGHEYILHGYVHNGGPNSIEKSKMVVTGELAKDLYDLALEEGVADPYRIIINGWRCNKVTRADDSTSYKFGNFLRKLSREIKGNYYCEKNLF